MSKVEHFRPHDGADLLRSDRCINHVFHTDYRISLTRGSDHVFNPTIGLCCPVNRIIAESDYRT